MEQWKDIPGFENYMVSDQGRVWSKNREKLLKQQLNHKGYNHISLLSFGIRYRKLVHRLVLLAFLGESNLQVNHKNSIKTDNRLENLEYVTQSENIIHSIIYGFKSIKISKEMVESIKNRYSNGDSQGRIAKDLNVSQSLISRIINNKRRKFG